MRRRTALGRLLLIMAGSFAVVGHVYDFAESRRPFELWFRFLHALDPTGARRRTVTEEWLLNGG